MNLHIKLQSLRKQKGLTQEELAQALFVSRTAISKWESGRGYPNIDSLKAIARYFGITVDELLSGDELLIVAEEDHKKKQTHLRYLVFGLLDLSAAMLLFLPLFAERTDHTIREVSLLSLRGNAPLLPALYLTLVACMIVSGILLLAMQNCDHSLWLRTKNKLSFPLHIATSLLFIVSLQPYPAVYLFVTLLIKALILAKKQ